MAPKKPPAKLVDPGQWNLVPHPLKLLVVRLLACLVRCSAKKITRDIDVLELFAGQRALTFACQKSGFSARGCDILLEPELHNIETQDGLDHLCELMLQIKPGGVLWGALPCKSWIWIARNGTGRTSSNPGGHRHVPRIAEANLQVENFVALATVARLRGVDFVVENPSSSLIFKFEPLAELLSWSGAHMALTYMGCFESCHCKPLHLWSSWSGIAEMRRRKPQALEPLAERVGTSVNGRGKELTESAAYTAAFGMAFAKLLEEKSDLVCIRKAMKRPAAAISKSSSSSSTTSPATLDLPRQDWRKKGGAGGQKEENDRIQSCWASVLETTHMGTHGLEGAEEACWRAHPSTPGRSLLLIIVLLELKRKACGTRALHH